MRRNHQLVPPRQNKTLVISYDSIFDLRRSSAGPLLILAHNLGGRRDSPGEINHKYLKWGLSLRDFQITQTLWETNSKSTFLIK